MMVNTDASAASLSHLNGSKPIDPTPAPQPSAHDLRQARFAQNFSHIIAILMRDQQFRNLRLADLEWLVLPPVMAGQYKIAQAPAAVGAQSPAGLVVPAAVALWARVSPAIDKRLSEAPDGHIGLGFNDWASGDNIWLIAVAGDQRVVPRFLKQLKADEFKDQQVKMRIAGRSEPQLLS